jgi:adenosine deaminase
MTDAYATYETHPIDELSRAGVSLGVNADAYALVNTTLTQEYEILHRTFGWQREQFLQCNVNALRAAFIPDQVRDMLLAQLMARQRAVVLDATGSARAEPVS